MRRRIQGANRELKGGNSFPERRSITLKVGFDGAYQRAYATGSMPEVLLADFQYRHPVLHLQLVVHIDP
jgi:hypothetical protein